MCSGRLPKDLGWAGMLRGSLFDSRGEGWSGVEVYGRTVKGCKGAVGSACWGRGARSPHAYTLAARCRANVGAGALGVVGLTSVRLSP